MPIKCHPLLLFCFSGFFLITACDFGTSSSVESKNYDQSHQGQHLIEMALNSTSDKSLDRFLILHGSIKTNEIPILVEALSLKNKKISYRKNAMRLLSIARGAQETLKTVLPNQTDLPIWAIAVNSLCNEPDLPHILQSQRVLAGQALKSDEPEVLVAGLCAGTALGLPGTQQQAVRLIEWPDPDVRSAAARVLGFCHSDDCLSLLTEKLAVETDPVAYRALLMAVLNYDSPLAEDAIRKSYANSDNAGHLTILNALSASQPHWRDAFLLELAQTTSPEKLPALFDLSKNPDIEFVKICKNIFENEPPTGQPSRSTWISLTQPCREGLEKLAGQSLKGQGEALNFAHDWLKSQNQ